MKKILIGLVSLIMLNLPLSSNAMLVEDPTEWAKTTMIYHQLVEQLQKTEAQYSLLQEQYQKLQLLEADAEGHYGYGGLINGISDLSQREWSPSTWAGALQGLSGNNPARYQQLVKLYQSAHPTLSQSQFQQGASADSARDYSEQVQTNDAASVNASYAFNNVQQHLQHIYNLSSRIEQTPNTKAATDLNSRLLTELAYINVQQVKMQAMLNQQLAQRSASQIQAETDEAKFNTIH